MISCGEEVVELSLERMKTTRSSCKQSKGLSLSVRWLWEWRSGFLMLQNKHEKIQKLHKEMSSVVCWYTQSLLCVCLLVLLCNAQTMRGNGTFYMWRHREQ